MANANVHELTSDNFTQEVIHHGSPVLVDFWAPRCPPCRKLVPIIDRVADQFVGKVKVAKVNVDDHPELAIEYGINSIPRIMIFKGASTPERSIVGLTSEAELVKLLNEVTA